MANTPPLQRELTISLLLHLLAMALGVALALPFACGDACPVDEGKMWTLVPGVALLVGAVTAIASELGRSLAAFSGGWGRWAGLSFLVALLTAMALLFLARSPLAPEAHGTSFERGLAILLLAAASNAVLALAGAGIARWAGRAREAPAAQP
jgi:hypothetical protein